ncbi:MAG: hypothetical protein ABII12_03170 [Planctomycetota bacterium]
MIEIIPIAALILIAATLLKPLFALGANTLVDRLVDQELREYQVGAAEHIYRNALVGIDPAGYLKAFVPGDVFVGLAYEEVDNSSGTAGAKKCRVYVQGDFILPLTGVAITDVGEAAFATGDDAVALSGHFDGFVGRILGVYATNQAVVRLKSPGEKPSAADAGCYELVHDGEVFFPATGADGATDGPQYSRGFKLQSALGLGVLQIAGEDGGIQLGFDAVAEVASATISTPDVFPVDKAITFEGRLRMSDIGDAAAIDLDFGLGTLLTANSIASTSHADMVNLACFHMNGASANISAQSDDEVTDVAVTDTVIDNATDADKDFKIIARPTGVVEFWIDGARVLADTVFAVGAAAALCGFVNMEKTSDNTVGVVKIDRIRVAGGRA